MVGILVIAHAPLASALGRCAEHVYSCEPNARRALRVLDVDGTADVDGTCTRARELMHEIDGGDGVLILTDAIRRDAGQRGNAAC